MSYQIEISCRVTGWPQIVVVDEGSTFYRVTVEQPEAIIVCSSRGPRSAYDALVAARPGAVLMVRGMTSQDELTRSVIIADRVVLTATTKDEGCNQ